MLYASTLSCDGLEKTHLDGFLRSSLPPSDLDRISLRIETGVGSCGASGFLHEVSDELIAIFLGFGGTAALGYKAPGLLPNLGAAIILDCLVGIICLWEVGGGISRVISKLMWQLVLAYYSLPPALCFCGRWRSCPLESNIRWIDQHFGPAGFAIKPASSDKELVGGDVVDCWGHLLSLLQIRR